MSASSPKTRVFFFSHPRTASNLLVKLLSDQQGWLYNEYNFHPSYQYAVRNVPLEDPTQTFPEISQEYSKLLAKGVKNLEKFLAIAEEEVGQSFNPSDGVLSFFANTDSFQQTHAFVKDHALMLLRPELIFPGLPQNPLLKLRPSSNPTIFPDALLQTFVPIFLIRHPALIFDSWFRLQSPFSHPTPEPSYTLVPQLKIYEWYKQSSTKTPIILDADDVIERPGVVEKVRKMLGMKQEVPIEWEAMDDSTKEGLGEKKRVFLNTFINSRGILEGKSSRALDMELKKAEWKLEFGEEGMEWLIIRTEAAMEDYEYLKGLRMT